MVSLKKLLFGVIITAMLLSQTVYPSPRVGGVFTTTAAKQVQVSVAKVNLRTGAGLSHSIITSFPKGTVLDVLGQIGSWYVVKTPDDTVGCITSAYAQVYSPAPAPAPSFTSMQLEMLGYINTDRAANGLAPLTLDPKLNNGAQLKSQDMVNNNYFSHTSPTYGSPFDMMKSLGITYQTAGENIAINNSVKAAHDAFMNSSGHRANILNSSFHKLGLGFVQNGQQLYVTEWFTD
ncbi:MAG: CAP domain-containing protein [Candidatus Saccharibacteria bacterium]